MRGEKRHRFQIYFEILSALCDEMPDGEKSGCTRVARKVNMAYDRFQKYLNQLVGAGMVVSQDRLVLTETGKEYIEEYIKFEGFLRRTGLLKH